MATLTVHADTSDGMTVSTNTVYATARAGSGVTAITNRTEEHLGQRLTGADYECYQAGLRFDTSGVPDSAIISSAILSLAGFGSAASPFPVLEARASAWGATYETADFIAGASLSGLTLLGSYDTAGGWATDVYAAFSDTALAANINKTGYTNIIIHDQKQRTNVAPTGTEFVDWRTADNSGTTIDPKIVITYTLPTGGAALFLASD